MNILVIHEVSYRKKVVYEYQDFAERLAARGHRVSVLDFDDTGDHRYRCETLSRTGVGEVHLENTPYLNLPLVKYLSGRWNHTRLLKQKLEKGAVDVVLLYSVFINGTNTVRLCHRYGIPVVYRVLDAYHKLRQNPLIEWPLYFGEKFIYRNADLVSVTNEKLGGYVEQLRGTAEGPGLRVLHHGVDTDHFRPLEADAELGRYWGIDPGDKVILYLGTTYDFSNLDALTRLLPSMAERTGPVKLVVVGGGALDEKLHQLQKDPTFGRFLVHTGFQGYPQLPGLLALADVCVNPFALNDVTRDIVPIKILQYLASGRATLSSPLPELVRLFPEGSGLGFSPLEPLEVFAHNIEALLVDKGLRQQRAEAGLRFVQQHFSMHSRIDRLEAILRESRDQRRRVSAKDRPLATEASS